LSLSSTTPTLTAVQAKVKTTLPSLNFVVNKKSK